MIPNSRALVPINEYQHAAVHAVAFAAVLSETGWLPSCMAPQPQADTENRANATASSTNANDTDADDSAAA